MSDVSSPGVLVVFQSDSGEVEQQALAVALGAVEAGASIRLRRLAADGAAEIAHRGYGQLSSADLAWADALVLGVESANPDPPELAPLFALLGDLVPARPGLQNAYVFSLRSSILPAVSALRGAGLKVIAEDPAHPAATANSLDRRRQAGRELISGLHKP